MKKLKIAILALALTSCEEVFNPKICLTCVAHSWQDVSEFPLSGFPDYGKGTGIPNYDKCDMPKNSKDHIDMKKSTRYIYRNGVGYKINRTTIYDCNPKK